MSTSREGTNPLRPYYVPPSIGPSADVTATTSQVFGSKNGTVPTYASSARDIFSDIDYSEYVPEGSLSTVDMIKDWLDQALYKYASVLLAQPFEVAKTVLQVRSQASGDGSLSKVVTEDMQEDGSSYRESAYEVYNSDESDPDEPAYFTSSAPSSTSYSPSRSRRRHITDRSGYIIPAPGSSSSAPHQLTLKRKDSVLEVISQLWTVEGAWGVWKGSNTTFIYSVLFKAIEVWSRSFLAAIVNVPDAGFIAGFAVSVDVADSPYPWLSLGVAVAASAATGLLLAPLDMVRTKLILASTSAPKRSFLHNLRQLPSYTCPPSLVVPTVLHSIISPLMTQSTSLFLRSQLAIDPILTPITFSVATFCTSTVELFMKLPIETVLRRGQMSVVSSSKYVGSGRRMQNIVDTGPYTGTLSTMWLIVQEEGVSNDSGKGEDGVRRMRRSGQLGNRKGQGIEGLWRGWRVGMWGLVGLWGAAALGGAANTGGEF